LIRIYVHKDGETVVADRAEPAWFAPDSEAFHFHPLEVEHALIREDP